MEPTKTIAAALVVVLAAGGAAAGVAYPGAMGQAAPADAPTNVDASATLDDGTVTVTVTDAGDPLQNASVYADDESVGTTDENGTVTFDLGDAEELDVELRKAGFEGELEYEVQNGSLHLVEESYEYDDGDDESEDGPGEGEEHRSPNADDGAENADQARSDAAENGAENGDDGAENAHDDDDDENDDDENDHDEEEDDDDDENDDDLENEDDE